MPEWQRDTPWRQGHLLGDDAIDALGLHHAEKPEQTVVLVATHDCDLAQDPVLEPSIEVVVGCLTNKDGNSTHAKNARKLHIEIVGAAAYWAALDAVSKVAVDKYALNQFQPRADAHITPENHAIFQRWLASRYHRSAFPDEFNRRVKEFKLDEKIVKAVKQSGDLIAGVFFDVDEGNDVSRDGPDDTYRLDITILYAADVKEAVVTAQQAAVAIEKAFKEKLFDPRNQWQHIELRYCEAISESALTYQHFKQLKRWQLDYLSLSADPQQPVLAE